MCAIQKVTRTVFLLFFSVFLAAGVRAQTYEIRAVNKGGGLIGVEIRITSGTPPTTASFVTDIVFGLKWSAAYNVDLTDVSSPAFNIRKSGSRTLKDGFHFQSFYADNTPFNLPVNLQLNDWVEIMSVNNTKTGTGTGTFEIAEPGFNSSTNPNIGIDLVDYTPAINGSAINVLLPVKLTRFDAIPAKGMIKVLWATADEQSSKGFEVERAEGEPGSFKRIAGIKSKTNSSNNEYEFLDKAVTAKVKYHYRLKQIDNNDAFKYSDVKTATLDGVENAGIYLLPNPVDKILQVSFTNATGAGMVTLKVVDAKGAVVLQQSNYLNASRMVSINVGGLAGGQYYMVIEKNKALLDSQPFQKN